MRGFFTGLVFVSIPLLAQHGSTTAVNPYTGPAHIAEGIKLYKAQCSGCHGWEGGGTSAGPTLTAGTFRHGGSDEALFQVISKGVQGTSMPAFNFSGLQIWQLVTAIRSMNIAHGAGSGKGDAQAGAALFRASCQGCHTVGFEGGLNGPDLSSVGLQRPASEVRESILDPHAKVASEYWSVSVQTSSGQKLQGRRLNEDTHSIQLRDRQGRLISVRRADIAQSELIRQSPMPSFAGKLSEAQMDDLLAYLTGLKGEQ